jgi:hypothetical protein
MNARIKTQKMRSKEKKERKYANQWGDKRKTKY